MIETDHEPDSAEAACSESGATASRDADAGAIASIPVSARGGPPDSHQALQPVVQLLQRVPTIIRLPYRPPRYFAASIAWQPWAPAS